MIKKLEIAAGLRPAHKGKDWIRHDKRKFDCIDLVCDVWELPSRLRENLPLERIFCRNFLEHLTMTEATCFVRMCCNMLGEDGILTVEVPNMDYIVEKYVEGEYDDPEDFVLWMFGGTGDEWWNLHKTMYNEALIRRKLVEGGFAENRIRVRFTEKRYRISATARK